MSYVPSRYVTFGFYANNISAAVDANAISGNVNQYAMPLPGSIVAIGVRLTEARTAGSLDFKAQINGAAAVLTATIDGTNTQTATARLSDNSATFVVGDRVGITIAFTGFTPTTSDADILLIVDCGGT